MFLLVFLDFQSWEVRSSEPRHVIVVVWLTFQWHYLLNQTKALLDLYNELDEKHCLVCNRLRVCDGCIEYFYG